MVFILSFAVFGASGVQKPFPGVGFCFVLFKEGLLTPFDFNFSGRGILLEEMLIIVMAMGH